MTSRTYSNPIVKGFYPDPSIVRVGDDYYMAHSTFQYFPAVVLTHSRDLVHWKTVGHAVGRTEDLDLSELEDSHGIWAPDLSFHDGRFVLYATLRLNNPAEGSSEPRRRQLMITAPAIEGPWSEPVFLEIDDIDPALFVDTDGNRYLVIAPGATLVPLNLEGTAPAGPAEVIWAGTGRRAPEGPRLFRKDDWYYLLLAEGGTEWGHCVTVARSRSLRGPYEPCPHNPILTQSDPGAPLQRAGHGQLVQTQGGDWWMVYLCGRPNGGPFTTLGRETALDPVEWVDGWPVVNQGRGPSVVQEAPRLPPSPRSDPTFDSFDQPRLSPVWQFVRNPDPAAWSVTDRPGWLRLRTDPRPLSTLGAHSLVLRRETDHRYTATTRLDFEPRAKGAQAGLICYYDRANHITLALVGRSSPVFCLTEVRDGVSRVVAERTIDSGHTAPRNVVQLRVEVREQVRTFLARPDGGRWLPVGTVKDASFLSDEGVVRGKHHTGTLVGLYANAGSSSSWGPADFDWFDYAPGTSQKSPKGGHQNPGGPGYAEFIMKASPTPKESDAPWLALARSMVKRHVKGTEKWHYEHGLLLQALEEVGLRSGDPTFQDFVQAYMEALVSPDGRILTYRDDEFNLDQVNPGKTAMILAARSTDPRWKACLPRLRDQLAHQPRTASGGFWHKKIYPDQMWLDGLYMEGPFLARWGREYGTVKDIDEVVRQLALIENRARDTSSGLLYHAWDESRRQLWADPDTGCSPHFWSRALGWYAMALVDVLDWVPHGHDGVRTLKAILDRLVDALAVFQDPGSGRWFQVLDQGQRPGNYLETSGSSMFAYALYKGLRQGYLDDPKGTRRAMADRAWAGLVKDCLKQDEAGDWHLGGICSVAGLGGTPYRDGSFQYYVSEPVVDDDYKGVGPFLLAGLEREFLA